MSGVSHGCMWSFCYCDLDNLNQFVEDMPGV